MAEPTQQATRANPKAWCDDQPEDPSNEMPVVDLPDAGNDERQNRRSTRFAHLGYGRRYLPRRKPMSAISEAIASYVAIVQ